MLSMLVFSAGIMSMLGLLSNTLIETASVEYRSKASAIASNTLVNMMIGDKSLGNLRAQYVAPNGAQYQELLNRVQSNLPGTLEAKNYPTISIGNKGVVEIKIKWKSPSDQLDHQIMMSSVIAE
jgi:Tfp pilus assembly protein PilV